jgi:hypothetical protein
MARGRTASITPVSVASVSVRPSFQILQDGIDARTDLLRSTRAVDTAEDILALIVGKERGSHGIVSV